MKSSIEPPRIMRHSQVAKKPYHLTEKEPAAPGSYQQTESLTMEKIRQDLEEQSFQRGYGQARSERAGDLDTLSQKLGDLKKEIWLLIVAAKRYENRSSR